jgi:hypothetical protein
MIVVRPDRFARDYSHSVQHSPWLQLHTMPGTSPPLPPFSPFPQLLLFGKNRTRTTVLSENKNKCEEKGYGKHQEWPNGKPLAVAKCQNARDRQAREREDEETKGARESRRQICDRTVMRHHASGLGWSMRQMLSWLNGIGL